MSCKQNISSKSKKVCIGRMDKRITFYKRTQQWRSGGTVNVFEEVFSCWANLKTSDGLQKFSGINIEQTPTHTWQCRYRTEATSELWIKYNNNYYDIITIQPTNDYDYMMVKTRETGESDLKGSES